MSPVRERSRGPDGDTPVLDKKTALGAVLVRLCRVCVSYGARVVHMPSHTPRAYGLRLPGFPPGSHGPRIGPGSAASWVWLVGSTADRDGDFSTSVTRRPLTAGEVPATRPSGLAPPGYGVAYPLPLRTLAGPALGFMRLHLWCYTLYVGSRSVGIAARCHQVGSC